MMTDRIEASGNSADIVRAAFEIQAAYCDANQAPITAQICRALAGGLSATTETGRAVLGWTGNAVADGLALRLVGGVHDLWLTGDAPELDELFKGEARADDMLRIVAAFLERQDAALLPWLDSPPQTNEPGRSASLMTGLLHLAERHGGRMEIIEIGSSAGLNLLIDRFHMDLGGVKVGPEDSTVQITPEWRGSPPPHALPDILSVRGSDIQPMDATRPANERRLLAYIWQDHPARFERVAKAIAMQREQAVDLVKADAADWVETQLTLPQEDGVMRVLMHSIMWQYMDEARQRRITDAMEAAGAKATPDRPVGWVAVEADRNLSRHDIVIRSWPGHGEPMLIGHAHAHGFWVEHSPPA